MRYSIRILLVLLLLWETSILSAETAWQEFNVLPGESVWASSVLEETLSSGTVRYAPVNLFDGNRDTAWVEAAEGLGIGQTVTFTLDSPYLELDIINGFARSAWLFAANGRPKRLKVTLLAGFTAPGLISETDAELYFTAPALPSYEINLADTRESQSFEAPYTVDEQETAMRRMLDDFWKEYPFFGAEQAADLDYGALESLDEETRSEFEELALIAFGTSLLRLEILEVYPGSRYQDTCISEVKVTFPW